MHPIDSHGYRIEMYFTSNGRCPFMEWTTLYHSPALKQMYTRLTYVRAGHLRVYKNLKDGVYELKIFHGPGYRIYFAFIDVDTILILTGGTKKTQARDIHRAKHFLETYTDEGTDNGQQ